MPDNMYARYHRNAELRSRESEIIALYRLFKTDEEIAQQLHLDVTSVRVARASMTLPMLRTKSGRLFTPEMDAQLMAMRDDDGQGFRAIGKALGGITAAEVEVRHRLLTRVQDKKEATKHAATIPCIKCRRPFWSDDKRRVRFCKLCRNGIEVREGTGPFDF